jgi:hypothetical protein
MSSVHATYRNFVIDNNTTLNPHTEFIEYCKVIYKNPNYRLNYGYGYSNNPYAIRIENNYTFQEYIEEKFLVRVEQFWAKIPKDVRDEWNCVAQKNKNNPDTLKRIIQQKEFEIAEQVRIDEKKKKKEQKRAERSIRNHNRMILEQENRQDVAQASNPIPSLLNRVQDMVSQPINQQASLLYVPQQHQSINQQASLLYVPQQQPVNQQEQVAPLYVHQKPIDASQMVETVYKDHQQSCSVCLSDYKDGDNQTKLKCNHMFHTNCIIPWLNKNRNCPHCRVQINI